MISDEGADQVDPIGARQFRSQDCVVVEPLIVGKPEPHMIETALARLGTARSATLLIGDQIPTDIQAGKRAGLPTVLVTTGVPLQDGPSLEAPDFVVSSLVDIEVAPTLVGSSRQRRA